MYIKQVIFIALKLFFIQKNYYNYYLINVKIKYTQKLLLTTKATEKVLHDCKICNDRKQYLQFSL